MTPYTITALLASVVGAQIFVLYRTAEAGVKVLRAAKTVLLPTPFGHDLDDVLGAQELARAEEQHEVWESRRIPRGLLTFAGRRLVDVTTRPDLLTSPGSFPIAGTVQLNDGKWVSLIEIDGELWTCTGPRLRVGRRNDK
ncbi:MAG: hypothetical protein JOY78_20355 [Pseudonocardia sp.]|nr:hypothetical protein [Pseudonocardia sp.]